MNNASMMSAYPHLRKRLMLFQSSLTNKLKEHLIISTTMEVITFNPTIAYQTIIIQGWNTHEDFSFKSQNFQCQEGSSYKYHEQIQQPADEEMFYALWNEVKKDHATWEAKMNDKSTNEEAHMTNLGNPIGQLAYVLEEEYFRTLPSDIKDEDIRECNFVPLSFKEEIQELTMVEEKKNELANEEELLVEKRQFEEHHSQTTIEKPDIEKKSQNLSSKSGGKKHLLGRETKVYKRTLSLTWKG